VAAITHATAVADSDMEPSIFTNTDSKFADTDPSPLTAGASRDDIIRANDGAFAGLASGYDS
jgi:hypothetical protein